MDPTRLRLFKKTKYWQETNAIIQHCMTIAHRRGLNTTQLARACDLSPATVVKNSNEQVGLRQELTLWKLCAAVGLQLGRANRSNGIQVEHHMAGIRKALDRKPAKLLSRNKKKKSKRRKRN